MKLWQAMKPPSVLRALPVFAFALLAGCGGGFQSRAPAEQTYVLRAASAAAAMPAPDGGGVILRLARPLAAPGLESDHIVLVQPDNRLNHFADSRWAAPLPEVVEALAVQTLRNSGAWRAVVDSRGPFPTDYYLQITIRRFDADYSSGGAGAPIVRVSLECLLGRRIDRELLATFVAEASEEAGENRLTMIVAAFERAAQSALTTVAEQSAAALRTSTAQLPP